MDQIKLKRPEKLDYYLKKNGDNWEIDVEDTENQIIYRNKEYNLARYNGSTKKLWMYQIGKYPDIYKIE